MLVQPWLKDIVNSGEYSLMFFGGEFSHAVSKVPRSGEFRVQPEYGGIIGPCEPPPGSIELAQGRARNIARANHLCEGRYRRRQ